VFVFARRRRDTRLVSDWSSDVCSSDLAGRVVALEGQRQTLASGDRLVSDRRQGRWGGRVHLHGEGLRAVREVGVAAVGGGDDMRSEERRVGKECGCGWVRGQEKKKVVS